MYGTLHHPEESRKFCFIITEDDFVTYGNQVLAELKRKFENEEGWTVVSPNYEGLRGRCNSDKEMDCFYFVYLCMPVMPLNIESNIEGGISVLASRLLGILRSFKSLNMKLIS